MSESTSSLAGRIFISYRREETGYAAGWLYDRLTARFGGDQVFKDVDSIQLGDDFVEVITHAVGSCDVLLALIGDRWSTITDESGRHRLDDPDDFVRLEIEAALTRDVRVIPILVDGARMPAAAELPASLVTLVRRQSLELSPTSFEFDTNRLLKVLDSTLAEVRIAQDGGGQDVGPATGAPLATTTAAPAASGPSSLDPALRSEPGPSGSGPADGDDELPMTTDDASVSGRTRWLIAAGAGALVVLLIVVVVLVTRSDDSASPSASGADGRAIEVDASPVTSDDDLQLTGLSVVSRNVPPQVGDTVTVSYSLTNVGAQPIELEDTFVGARNAADDNKDAEDTNEGTTVEPGATISATGRVFVDSTGRWDVWPCYELSNGNQCPDKWQVASFLAAS